MMKSLTLLRPSFFPGQCLRSTISPSHDLRRMVKNKPSTKAKGILVGIDRRMIVQKAFRHELVRRIRAALLPGYLPDERGENVAHDDRDLKHTMCLPTPVISEGCTSLPRWLTFICQYKCKAYITFVGISHA
jgi:hypothetical protein